MAFTILPVSCLKSVSQRDTAVSSQKRPKSVLDTDDPYHVACLQPQPTDSATGGARVRQALDATILHNIYCSETFMLAFIVVSIYCYPKSFSFTVGPT